jgi:hypothetical protein
MFRCGATGQIELIANVSAHGAVTQRAQATKSTDRAASRANESGNCFGRRILLPALILRSSWFPNVAPAAIRANRVKDRTQ